MGVKPPSQIQSHGKPGSLGSTALPFPTGMSLVKSHQERQSAGGKNVTVEIP